MKHVCFAVKTNRGVWPVNLRSYVIIRTDEAASEALSKKSKDQIASVLNISYLHTFSFEFGGVRLPFGISQ